MEILIFCYQNTKNRSKAQTDGLILKSVAQYIRETGASCPAEELTVLRAKSGKPYVPDSGLFVGVTHTEKQTFVGVSGQDFGIDAEDAHREIRQKDRLLARFYSPEEQAEVLTLPAALQTEQMLRLWVKKEAMLKYSGVGISGLSDSDTKKAPGYFSKFSFAGVVGCLYAMDPVTYRLIENDFSAVGQSIP